MGPWVLWHRRGRDLGETSQREERKEKGKGTERELKLEQRLRQPVGVSQVRKG